MLVGDHSTAAQIRNTGDGIHNEKLYLSPKTLGDGTETITIDSDQNCLLMGPCTINCTLVINGTMKVI